jgi:hypothetical protein
VIAAGGHPLMPPWPRPAGCWHCSSPSAGGHRRFSLEWEAGAHGWLQLLVRGDGQLTHSAVLEGDEYGQSEDFGNVLPDWAASLLARLIGLGH